jgi:Putative lipoprotein LpqV
VNGSGKRRRVRADNTRKIRTAPSRPTVLHRFGNVRCCGCRLGLWTMAVLATGLAATIGGCSQAVSGEPTRAHERSSAVAGGPGSLPPDAIGVSPAGVTTRVDVPADSTEEEYFQACHAAKQWMESRPKNGESPVEPYLAMVQASPSGTAGSWNKRWVDLTPARQAAVITAAKAAVNDECG